MKSNPNLSSDPYSTKFLKNLFDEMSGTYGLTNLVASFGFTLIWRKRCVLNVPQKKKAKILDLMSGMGELLSPLSKHLQSAEQLTAIDFSSEMCRVAEKNIPRYSNLNCKVLEADALNSPIESGSIDYVFCSFGLKTLSQDQQKALAREISRVLKSGGHFSFMEISVPSNPLLKLPFLFYLRFVIPMIGKLMLGNPSNYRMLAFYTENFKNSENFHQCLLDEGLSSQYVSHFFGCATGVRGMKA